MAWKGINLPRVSSTPFIIEKKNTSIILINRHRHEIIKLWLSQSSLRLYISFKPTDDLPLTFLKLVHHEGSKSIKRHTY
jgi:hypothetical protein